MTEPKLCKNETKLLTSQHQIPGDKKKWYVLGEIVEEIMDEQLCLEKNKKLNICKGLNKFQLE